MRKILVIGFLFLSLSVMTITVPATAQTVTCGYVMTIVCKVEPPPGPSIVPLPPSYNCDYAHPRRVEYVCAPEQPPLSYLFRYSSEIIWKKRK